MIPIDFIEKLKNRYNIITFVLVILITSLSIRLAVLTIAQGDYYRDIADNKRLKEVYVTAPRGEIRDRYGRLLAGNKPSFTIRLFKDEINLYSMEEKNQAFLHLIRLLEEDGVNYVDDFPLGINVFKYASDKDYLSEELRPEDKVISIIEENNLIREVLGTHYTYDGYGEHYRFVTANRAINALQYKGIDMPIDIKIQGDQIIMNFDENKDISVWKAEYKLDAKDDPMESMIKLIGQDKAIIRKIIDHSLSRELIYEILEKRNLVDNIILEEYAVSYMEDYLNQKRILGQIFPEVTMETKAIDDFVHMFTEVSLNKFLGEVIVTNEENGEKLVPAQILKEMLGEQGIILPMDIEVLEEENRVLFKHHENNKIDQEQMMNHLIQLSQKSRVLKYFIQRDDIKYLAQRRLIDDGINSKIGVGDGFEYSAIRNLKNFYVQNKVKEDSSMDELFEALKRRYGIDGSLSKYEARGIMVLYNEVKKQGNLGYRPIYLAHGLKESTVARIEEGLINFNGVDVIIEPIRYYPEGTTAAHLLGYLGKISQTNEIQKYVEERKYDPGAIIGKTGLEESFEEQLSGSYGIRRVEVDAIGNTTKVIEEVKPVPGDNLYLSIDLKLQQVAEKALEHTLEELQKGGTYTSPWGNYKFDINRSKKRPYVNATSGAVVAIDVKTGQVLASASYPSYDPNLFSTGISNSDWVSLFPEDDKDPLAPRPLYNIATQTAIQPGSVFKMATALTALNKGLSPNKKIRDMGYVNIGGSNNMNCLLWTTNRRTHGYVDVYHALKDSCNYYFYSLAYGYNPRTGENIGTKIDIEDIGEMSKQLGLHDRTGIEINVPLETAVGVPSIQKKISGDRNLLRIYLNNNIDKYFEANLDYDKDFKHDEEAKKEAIEEILSWTEEETAPSRGDVIKRLEEMGLRPEYRFPNDRAGLADTIKYDYLRSTGWSISDILNITIGQGLNAYTPIQMANYIATLSNGGYRHKLTLLDNIKNYNNSETIYNHEVNAERIELNDYSHLDDIKQGVLLVSDEGTSTRTFGNFPVQVGSKTGTAQNKSVHPVTKEGYDEFSWFVGFAPYDDPQIAIAAVIFQGGSGGNSGPMVRDIMAEYLGLNNEGSQENLPFDNIISD